MAHVQPSTPANRCAYGPSACRAFVTIAEPHSSETEVKKSRFVTHAWPCSSADEALELIASRRDPSATHNCWAYLASGAGAMAGRGAATSCVVFAGRRNCKLQGSAGNCRFYGT